MEIFGTNNRALQIWSVVVFFLAVIIRIIPGVFVFGSEDVTAWVFASKLWENGQDPYVQAYVFNWPPFWLSVVHGLIRAGMATGIPCHLMIKIPPIVADGVIALVILRIFFETSKGDLKKSLAGALVYALNPVSIVITAVHGNFISVPLSLLMMAVYFHVGEKKWKLTWTSLSLGCGIMSKVWPIAALPFFLQKIKSVRDKILFLFMSMIPVFVALLPLYLKNSEMVLKRFIKYQSQPGWWGVTGLGRILDVPALKSFAAWYVAYGSIVLLLALICLLFLTRRLAIVRVLLLVFLTVLFLLNGFGPQYLVLVLPFAIIMRSKGLLPFTILVSVLFCFEYGLIPLAGHYGIPCDGQVVSNPLTFEQFMNSNRLTNILRLPVWLFVGGWLVNELRSSLTPAQSEASL